MGLSVENKTAVDETANAGHTRNGDVIHETESNSIVKVFTTGCDP